MISSEKIFRINELANKKKFLGLNTKEIKEQNQLRKEYLQSIRFNMNEQLKKIKIIDKKKEKEN